MWAKHDMWKLRETFTMHRRLILPPKAAHQCRMYPREGYLHSLNPASPNSNMVFALFPQYAADNVTVMVSKSLNYILLVTDCFD